MRFVVVLALLVPAGCSVRTPAEPCAGCAERDVQIARLQTLASYAAQSFRTDLAPRPKMTGTVAMYSAQRRLVILTIGKDWGVLEGDEFLIHDDDFKFVAKVVVERVDRLWCSGRILEQRRDPRVDDFATNDPGDVDMRTNGH